MKWCLAEGRRRLYRKRLRKSHSISLIQDVSKGELVVRFVCCDKQLNVSRGTLGRACIDKDGSGIGLAHASIKLLRRFCTAHASPPRVNKLLKNKFDQVLFDHICAHVEELCADGTHDEGVAMDHLRFGGRVWSRKQGMIEQPPFFQMYCVQ